MQSKCLRKFDVAIAALLYSSSIVSFTHFTAEFVTLTARGVIVVRVECSIPRRRWVDGWVVGRVVGRVVGWMVVTIVLKFDVVWATRLEGGGVLKQNYRVMQSDRNSPKPTLFIRLQSMTRTERTITLARQKYGRVGLFMIKIRSLVQKL